MVNGRQKSGTGRPPSACFKIPNICVSLNRLVFIVNLLVHFAEKILLLNPINARGDYQTNSWRWPLAMFTYLTALAYLAAWIVFHTTLLFT